MHKYVPMPIQGHPPEQAPQPVVRPFRVPFTLPDRTKQPDAADAAAPDAAAVPGGSAAGEGGKEGGSGDKGGGEPSERPAGEEAAAKTRVIPVPFKVEKQGAAAEATGGEEAAGGKARIVPMPYQKAAVSRPAARVEPVPELTDFYAGWTPLQRWWFRVALCCFRPATSARVVPGTDATAFAEAMEKDAWRRAAEVADKESAAAVTLLEKYAAMPPPPASDREVVATLVAAVKRIGKWLIIACLIVFAGLSAMGAVVNNGIYVPGEHGGDMRARPWLGYPCEAISTHPGALPVPDRPCWLVN